MIRLDAAYSELIIEFDCFLSTFETTGAPAGAFFEIQTEDGVGQICLCFESESGGSANVQFKTDAGGTLGSATTGYPIPINAWFHIGIRVKISSTVGEVELMVDTGAGPVQEILDTGLDTEHIVGKIMQNFNVRRPNFSGSYFMDNLIVMDETGAKDNDFKGPSRVFYGLPATDGDLTDFTPLSSTNVSQVDERPPDEDSTYNQSPTSGHRDCFNFPTWTGVLDGALPIVGIRVYSFARKTDATPVSLKNFGRRSSVNYDGSNAVSLGDSFTAIADMDSPIEFWTEDPFDAADWTVAKLNAFQWGYTIP